MRKTFINIHNVFLSTHSRLSSPMSVLQSGLSESRRRLVDTMRQMWFGRIENLAVRNGEPSFDPAPRIIREVKFGGENAPRPESNHDFALKSQVVELLDHLTEIGDGSVQSIEVKYGLPFRLIVQQTV